MTKQQEIDALNKFVNALPQQSYLKSILKDANIEQMIRDDFAYDPLPELWKRQADEQKELKRIQDQTRDAQNSLDNLKREENRTQQRIHTLRDDARKLAHAAKLCADVS